MRVLVTGHRGYIGSVLVSVLRHARYEVVGLDCDLYEGCDFGRVREPIPEFSTDLRDVEFADLLSFDAVIHLAALPSSFCHSGQSKLIDEINVDATLRLAECCKQAAVSRFLFASTCAVYGRSSGEFLTEHTTPNPLTSCAASKLRCEQELARLADRCFKPVILRNVTAYGVSPRLRLDSLVNDFVASATLTHRIGMKTAGRAWRPLMHVEDIARVYAVVLGAPDEALRRGVFNIADTEQNYRMAEVAELVTEHVPSSTWSAASDALDERSYRVDGSRLLSAFPDFRFRWSLSRGIRQLRTAMLSAGLTPTDWRSDRFRRAARLNSLIENRHTDDNLRRISPLFSPPDRTVETSPGPTGSRVGLKRESDTPSPTAMDAA